MRDPELPFASPEEKAIAVAVTITAQVSEGRSIVMQTYIERDAPVQTHHQTLDKLSAAIDRQEAKVQLEINEAHLATEEKTLRQLKEDFVAIEQRARDAWEGSRKKGPWPGLSQAESAQKANATTNIKRYEEAIARRKADMEKLRGKIGE